MMLMLAGSRGNSGELTIEMIDGREIAYKISDLFCIHDGSVSNTREKCDVLLGPKRGYNINTKAGRNASIGSLQNW